LLPFEGLFSRNVVYLFYPPPNPAKKDRFMNRRRLDFGFFSVDGLNRSIDR